MSAYVLPPDVVEMPTNGIDVGRAVVLGRDGVRLPQRLGGPILGIVAADGRVIVRGEAQGIASLKVRLGYLLQSTQEGRLTLTFEPREAVAICLEDAEHDHPVRVRVLG